MELRSNSDDVFSGFVAMLETELQWEPGEFGPDSRLLEDCGLDSMGMYELLLILEETGWEVDEDALLSWATVRDVYDSYRRGITSTML